MILVLINENYQLLKLYKMRSLLYLIAVILVIGWVLGFFVYPVGGGLIHILLVIAVIAVLLGIIRRA